MKRIVIFSLIFSAMMTTAMAETTKSQYCPSILNIKSHTLADKRYFLSAFNQDNKYFYSPEMKYDDSNGPVRPLHLNEALTSYDARIKVLHCVYYAYDVLYLHPELINYGDY